MTSASEFITQILAGWNADGDDPPRTLADIPANSRDDTVERLLAHPNGRRWLRELPELDPPLAGRLLQATADFQTERRDRSLGRVVALADLEMLTRFAEPVASGPAAAVLWERLATDPDRLTSVARQIAAGGDSRAAETTLHLLLLDPLHPHGLTLDQRIEIAQAGLTAGSGTVRGLAAEFLATNRPAILSERLDQLATDPDERTRGFAWRAAFQTTPAMARDQALDLVGQVAASLAARRSALTALAENAKTADVADLLAFFVIHPEPDLAMDAANLILRLHRHPTPAMAAAKSPHPAVREIGAFLLDPTRGSPAAGGSRPGAPGTSDAFADLLRQLGQNEDPPVSGPKTVHET
jgi:hypothetical protein